MGLLRRARDRFNSIRNERRATRRNRALVAGLDPHTVEHLHPGISLASEWYGSVYGGFYLAPALLPADAIVYSVGIGKDISFDREVLRRHDCRVYGFDPTPKAIDYLTDKTPDRFTFHPYGLTAGRGGTATFYLPRDRNATSGSLLATDVMDEGRAIEVEMRTLGEIATDLGHSRIDVLKVDIEGAEYDVIPDVLDSGTVVDQLLLEFHDRMFDTPLPRSRETVSLLRARGYEVFAASDTFEEVSFVRVGAVPGERPA